MACSPEILRRVPLFGLLDDEETAVLAGQVELKTFAPRQRIYKIGDPGGRAYVMVSGRVRVADSVARFGGSWTFIIFFAVAIVAYVTTNHVLGKSSWDPYPFILLNLFLSMLAAIQAPVIMMSQNRQDTKDRLRSELDFDVNRRAASDIQGLSRKLNLLGEKIGDIEDLLRGRF